MSDSDERKALAGSFLFFYFVALFAFSIWFLSRGGFNEPWQQLYSFLIETKIKPQGLSRDIIIGFVLLEFYLSIGVVLFSSLIFRVTPKIYFEKWRKFLDLKFLSLFYNLLGGVSAEEIIFRWFPLVVLFPMWDTKLALWIIIVTSSIIFGLFHIYNQAPEDRKMAFVAPQVIGGIILSYIFLAFGFWGALAIHLVFDIILLLPLKVAYNIYPDILKISEQ